MTDPPSTDSAGSAGSAKVFLLPLALAGLLATLAWIPVFERNAGLSRTVLGGAAFLAAWAVVLFATGRGRVISLEIAIKKQHWVQACTQIAIFLYWGWYVRQVYAFFPLILAQLLFALGVDALLAWSRRDVHRLGFGPVPIILSINLFLLFRPDWFHWQFAMILVGYLAKELIRWERDGRSAHVFNPSSFPLGVFALALLVTGNTDMTLGPFIAQSQFVPPYMYAFIFLVSIPVQLLFGVARMTVVAAATMVGISFLYLGVTGTYMFKDAFISLPVFLGMHLLFTDPSTSPRSELGQVIWGVTYALGITAFFFILDGLNLPTFYEKLLPVPLMNLTVRFIDGIARSETLRGLDPARLGAALTPMRRNAVYTSAWVGVFAIFATFGILDDHHEGQYYPFWEEACAAGSERACEYRAFMLNNYCGRDSGWACNEFGIVFAERGGEGVALEAFNRSCSLGFEPGCTNAARMMDRERSLARSEPPAEELPILLRGSKGPVTERDPARLRQMACAQGWSFCQAAAGT